MVRDAKIIIVNYEQKFSKRHTPYKRLIVFYFKPQILTVLSRLPLTRVLPSGLIAIQ